MGTDVCGPWWPEGGGYVLGLHVPERGGGYVLGVHVLGGVAL